MSVFWEIHQDNPREGPGDNISTRKAFKLLKHLPLKSKILDIGCGPGMQTIELAQISSSLITAVDNYQPFLDTLKSRAEEAEVADRIKVVNQSMFNLDLPHNAFDVIWSEGAIYIIGFQKGLEEWREFLKPRGYIAVTEVAWLKPDPPKILKEFWQANYPALKTVEENSQIIRDAGYLETGRFILPEAAWWEDYYNPVMKRVSMLRAKYAGNPEALQELDAHQKEVALYRHYHDYYGYAFYVMQKPD
jgi:ubiquinone/menaquinone biosynthesis C-methylase UbiE